MFYEILESNGICFNHVNSSTIKIYNYFVYDSTVVIQLQYLTYF